MRPTFHIATALAALLALAVPASAQEATATPPPATRTSSATPSTDPKAAEPKTEEPKTEEQKILESWTKGREIPIQYYRALDRRGLNVFETTKAAGAEFKGFRLDLGAAFTSQVQDLTHRNGALPVMASGVNANELQKIGFGFNNSTANLYLNAQLAPGIRVALTSYLSSRHHNETWVKDGYLQIDESPIDFVPLKALMQIVTIRAGHFEINYGDAHFRRSDNGNAMYNPFVGNYIMDAFTTEIGGEVYLKGRGIIAMGAVTAGEIRGTVTKPGERGPAFIGKLGFDRQMNKDLRVRMTGSAYIANKASSNTLYGGDRSGSRYYWVMENTTATENGNFTSGLINPGFKNEVTAMQFNPFVKFRGLELFGVLERAEGRASTESAERVWKQVGFDAVYRFAGDDLFVGARYNRAAGTLPGIADEVGARRVQVGAGWFILPAVLTKVEYVNQKYFGYPAANKLNGGRFNGLMLEGIVAF